MTDRIPLDEMTSDALYERLDKLGRRGDHWKAKAIVLEAARDHAEATLARVRKALDDAAWGGPDRSDVIDEIRAALAEPKEPTT